MPTIPSLAEIEETIGRMERRYVASASGQPEIGRLLGIYRRLGERFVEDLAEPRDIALSRAAALMMIRYITDEPPMRMSQ